MERKLIEEKVIECLIDQDCGDHQKEEFTLTARIRDDLKFDSLDEVELVMNIEEEFTIEISDEEATLCNTVNGVVDLVVKKLAKKEAK